MIVDGHDIGVCSWSLRPADISDLVAKVRELGLDRVQLALAPLVMLEEARRRHELDILRASGLTVTAGMVDFPGENYSSIATIRESGGYAPDAQWPQRQELTRHCTSLAQQLGLRRISTHIGFIPPSNQDAYKMMLKRIAEIAAPLAEAGIELLMETGQETASELLQFLNDLACRNVDINFDPANMILYGAGDPMEAIGILGRHIHHVHVKDATLSAQPGVIWGTEVPFGKGDVNPAAFLSALKNAGYTGPLMIECEIPTDDRISAIRFGLESLGRFSGASTRR